MNSVLDLKICIDGFLGEISAQPPRSNTVAKCFNLPIGFREPLSMECRP